MKILSLIFIAICFINIISADGVFNSTLDFGTVAKGKLYSQKFDSIPLPQSNFNLQGIQAIIINKTSNAPFDHGFLSTCALDFTINGKKIVSFTASNINNQLSFPSPYVVPVTDTVTLTVQMYTLNKEPVDVLVQYYMKWTEAGTSSTFVKLTRTASSVVANYSSFNVPAGNGQGYTIQNSITWTSNAEVMDFQATVSPGIISLSFIEDTSGTQTVICKSTPVYIGKVFMKMTPCNTVQSLYKGSTYITQAVYNNTVALKNVFGTFGFYAGYPNPHTTTTTGGHSTTGGASTTGGHSTTGGASTTGGHSTTGGGTGGHSTGGGTGGHTTGGGSGGHTGGTTAQTSGSHSESESESSDSSISGSSQFTSTTGASSQPSPDSSDQTSSTYTSGTSGSSGLMWTGDKRKVEFY
ncbi:hypothetical protein DICPUDRAFT_37479 [Dictyostelium purpureum]|uniref:Uncharacterized protein n=1 Tax=Dictyostelium purpureum TaxID=5786 RepID=F0ZSX5_DICPU|nr:uncharacterized protein DICPUDRAFT_37479 [Dictyostelium purpureum]EGC32946.1 hypothetical protein DICPUDRAFT_37479 [Dictyostelium purpureum]|eukprot:XP_003290512.1 hypothetical protein DICPUDRAFT_37479 [Dictyostelium purpureum]